MLSKAVSLLLVGALPALLAACAGPAAPREDLKLHLLREYTHTCVNAAGTRFVGFEAPELWITCRHWASKQVEWL